MVVYCFNDYINYHGAHSVCCSKVWNSKGLIQKFFIFIVPMCDNIAKTHLPENLD